MEMKKKMKTIPKKLQSENVRLVKLQRNSKIPFEKDWPNIPHTFGEIQKWIELGNNYGMLGLFDFLMMENMKENKKKGHSDERD